MAMRILLMAPLQRFLFGQSKGSVTLTFHMMNLKIRDKILLKKKVSNLKLSKN